MEKYTRQQAKALGLPTCYGSLCAKHPELGGLRRVSGACAECAKDMLRKSRASNAERTQAQRRKDYLKGRAKPEVVERKKQSDAQYRKANKEKFRASIIAWGKNNPEKVRLYAKRVRQNNPGAKNADTAKRRYAKIQRTPAWLTEDDFWMLEQAYELAALRSKMFGFQWHVDHIVPLQGEIVSGLHVPTNVQVIPGFENVSKGNKFEAVT